MEKENKNLEKLSTLSKDDQKVYKPDYINWNVLDNKGFKLGEVSDIVVDIDEDKARYVDVVLEHDPESHFLIPIGMVKPDKDQHALLTSELDKESIDKHPKYKKDQPITRAYEIDVRTSFLPERTTFPEELESDFYNHNHFAEHNLFGIRSTTRSRQIKKGDHQKLNWDQGLGRD